MCACALAPISPATIIITVIATAKREIAIADFHSLRHTFGTLLAQSGVSPQEAQRLMRHSTINLTMNLYTHLTIQDKARAINKLPPIVIKHPKQVKTGTCDVPENLTANLTGNPVKIQQNTPKSSKHDKLSVIGEENVNPCKTSMLQQNEEVGRGGLEPPTHGFSVRYSGFVSTCQ